MSQMTFRFLATFAILISGCTHEPGAKTNLQKPSESFLGKADLPHFQMSPPFASDSQEQRLDLSVVLDWQQKRTDQDCAEINAEGDASYGPFFGDLVPAPSDKRQAKIWETFFSRVAMDGQWVSVEFKDRFLRPRPFQVDTNVNPCTWRPENSSYPSGHAAIGRVLANALAEIYPERRAEILERSKLIGLHRVMGGVHFPSDVRAGEELADQIFKVEMGKTEFRDSLNALKAARRGVNE